MCFRTYVAFVMPVHAQRVPVDLPRSLETLGFLLKDVHESLRLPPSPWRVVFSLTNAQSQSSETVRCCTIPPHRRQHENPEGKEDRKTRSPTAKEQGGQAEGRRSAASLEKETDVRSPERRRRRGDDSGRRSRQECLPEVVSVERSPVQEGAVPRTPALLLGRAGGGGDDGGIAGREGGAGRGSSPIGKRGRGAGSAGDGLR